MTDFDSLLKNTTARDIQVMETLPEGDYLVRLESFTDGEVESKKTGQKYSVRRCIFAIRDTLSKPLSAYPSHICDVKIFHTIFSGCGKLEKQYFTLLNLDNIPLREAFEKAKELDVVATIRHKENEKDPDRPFAKIAKFSAVVSGGSTK